MRFLSFVSIILLSSVGNSQGSPTASSKASSTSTVFQLESSNTWFENLAVRSNGQIIATRMDAPELWLIDPFTKTGHKLVTVPGITGGAIGIAEQSPDVFIFGAANFTIGPVVVDYGTMGLYRLDLNRRNPAVSLVASLPDSLFLNGIARWNDKEVLVADTEASAIYRVDVTTGSSETVLQGSVFATTNGIAVQGKYLYYTKTGSQAFFRVPLTKSAKAAGPVQLLYQGLPLDDFALASDGTAYISTMERNQIIRVSPNGDSVTVAGAVDNLAVAASSSVRWGRTRRDSKTLYVTTSGGALTPIFGTLVEPAKIVAVNLGSK
ncbi:hypothetical protein BKA56DRAFT_501027 [Ilyonectria sp. MPI-CAGE-AT-0026]|nr:hypothetical protein BKA56DRAFT_501027 [Ilyonectria sp. MPI-CAGE-AT-0026]